MSRFGRAGREYLERGIARSADPTYNKSGERSPQELWRPPLRGRQRAPGALPDLFSNERTGGRCNRYQTDAPAKPGRPPSRRRKRAPQPRKVLRTFRGVSFDPPLHSGRGLAHLRRSRAELHSVKSTWPPVPRTRDRLRLPRASRSPSLRRQLARRSMRGAHRLRARRHRRAVPVRTKSLARQAHPAPPQNVFGVAAAVKNPLDRFERPAIVDLTAAHAAAISQSPSSNPRIASRYQAGIVRARRSARSTRTSVC